MNFAWRDTMFLGYEMGFWVGLIVVGGLTLVLTLFAWLLPPKKKKPTAIELAAAE